MFKPGENMNMYSFGRHCCIIVSKVFRQRSRLKPSADFRGTQGSKGLPWIFHSFWGFHIWLGHLWDSWEIICSLKDSNIIIVTSILIRFFCYWTSKTQFYSSVFFIWGDTHTHTQLQDEILSDKALKYSQVLIKMASPGPGTYLF